MFVILLVCEVGEGADVEREAVEVAANVVNFEGELSPLRVGREGDGVEGTAACKVTDFGGGDDGGRRYVPEMEDGGVVPVREGGARTGWGGEGEELLAIRGEEDLFDGVGSGDSRRDRGLGVAGDLDDIAVGRGEEADAVMPSDCLVGGDEGRGVGCMMAAGAVVEKEGVGGGEEGEFGAIMGEGEVGYGFWDLELVYLFEVHVCSLGFGFCGHCAGFDDRGMENWHRGAAWAWPAHEKVRTAATVATVARERMALSRTSPASSLAGTVPALFD